MFGDFYTRRLVRAANDTAINATMEKEPVAAPSSVLPLGFGVISFIVLLYLISFGVYILDCPLRLRYTHFYLLTVS